MNGRVSLVIVAARTGCSESAIEKTVKSASAAMRREAKKQGVPLCILAPLIVRQLLLDQFLQVDGLVKLIRLCSRIADITFGVKCLGDLHDRLTVHAEESTAHHLQINSRQRQRPPFAGGLLVHFRDLGIFRGQAPLQHHCDRSAVEEMDTPPQEIDLNPVSVDHDLDSPKRFRFEILHPQISIDYESQGWELARPCEKLEKGIGASKENYHS